MRSWLLGFVLTNAPAPEPASFEWVGAPSCPSAEVARARLDGVPINREAPVSARAVITRLGGGFELRLTMRSGERNSERTLRSNSCQTLLDAAVFAYFAAQDGLARQMDEPVQAEGTPSPAVVPPVPVPLEPPASPADDAVALEAKQTAPTEASIATPAPTISAESTPSPAPAAQPQVDSLRQRRKNLEFGLRAHAGLGVGPLGVGSAPLGGSISTRGPAWRVEAGMVAYLPRSVFLDDGTGHGAALNAWGGRLRTCGVPRFKRGLQLPVCLQLEGGTMRARGLGVGVPEQPRAPHASASGVVALSYDLGSRVRLWAEVSGGAALVQPAFHVGERESALFRAPAYQLGLELGLELRFGPGSRSAKRESFAQADQSGRTRRL